MVRNLGSTKQAAFDLDSLVSEDIDCESGLLTLLVDLYRSIEKFCVVVVKELQSTRCGFGLLHVVNNLQYVSLIEEYKHKPYSSVPRSIKAFPEQKEYKPSNRKNSA